MTLHQLKQLLLSEFKRSWQKSAVLAALLAIGVAFWVPPLIRMVQGGPAPSSASAATTAASTPTIPAEKHAKPASGFDWKDTDDILASDVLLVPEHQFAATSDPFEVDYDQFAPPILFAQEEPAPEPTQPADPIVALSVVQPPTGLLLKGTFLGSQRKAAYINRRLYFEGTQIRHGTTSWLISAIQPRRVVLSHGGQQFELKLVAAPFLGDAEADGGHAPPSTEP
jgi:hypothetical protein